MIVQHTLNMGRSREESALFEGAIVRSMPGCELRHSTVCNDSIRRQCPASDAGVMIAVAAK
jgi:hypothetical protein